MTINTVPTTIDISLAKLTPSPANVRRTGAGAGIDALAASIQAHGLLQSLVVRPKPDSDGQESGRYEVVAGARRLAALKLLARQKQVSKGLMVPCRVLEVDGVSGSEASLAENVVRQDMHVADQFEAFQALHESGTSIEDIASRFGVSAHTVRQRLRLAGVSPALIQAYRDDVLTLDHLTAFAVTEDRAAQERLFGQLQDWQRSPDTIRRLLTNALIPATDRKAIFVGLDAYTAAGGTVQRDLFSEDSGGWIANAALLERLVAERMEAAAEAIRAEGWHWVGIGQEGQAGAWRLRRVWPGRVALSPEDEERRGELAGRYDELAEAHDSSADDLPDDVAAELERIETELAALDAKQAVFRPEDVAVAGVVITLASDGSLRIERGFVRPEDEARPEPVMPDGDGREAGDTGDVRANGNAGEAPIGGTVTPIRGEAEPQKAPALPGALLTELESQRTAGLQAAIARQPELAMRVLLHALATDAFYGRTDETVANIHTYPPALPSVCPSLVDSPAWQAITAAKQAWRARLPEHHGRLWTWLQQQDATTLLDLLAICVARTTVAGSRDWTTREGSQCIAAAVAASAGLDMRQCWTATKDGYLSQVPKALILEAVREGAGASAAHRLAGSRKDVMATEAETLLAGTGWLPSMLRIPSPTYPVDSGDTDSLTIPPLPLPMAAE